MNVSRRLLGLAVAGLALVALCLPARAAEPGDAAGIPGDAEIVVVAHSTQLFSSPLFKKYGLDQVKTILDEPKTKQVLQATGFDPLKDVDSVTLTNTSAKMDPTGKVFISVKGRFDVEKFKQVAEQAKFASSKEGRLTVYELPGPMPSYAAFLNKGTLVLSQDKQYLVDVTSGKVKTTSLAPDLKAALAKTSDKDTVQFAVVITDEIKDTLKMLPLPAVQKAAPKLVSISGRLNVTADAKLDIYLNMTDAGSAAALSGEMKKAIPQLKAVAKSQKGVPPEAIGLIDKIDISTEGKSATVSVKVTEDVIDSLIKSAPK